MIKNNIKPLCFNKKNLIALKRQSYTIGLFGRQGCGKTMILSWLGAIFYLYKKACIYSNYPLNYPYVYINDVKDFNKIYDNKTNKIKIFLGDDLERWFHSRATKDKSNVKLNSILIDFGKISCSTFYSSKRSMAIDIGLRDTTCEFWFPELYQAYTSTNKKTNNMLRQYLNFLNIKVTRYDEDLVEQPYYIFDKLTEICKLYETTSIVPKLQITDNPSNFGELRENL